jgi:hypothetical protein
MGTATSKIISGPEITKVPGPRGSEIWGQYKKEYESGLFGQQVFAPPASVDGVNIFCRCRDIPQFMKNNNTIWTRILSGITKPACWEDKTTIMDPEGGPTYEIHYKDPGFYSYSISKNGNMGIIKNLATSNVKASFLGIPWQAFAVGYAAKNALKGGKTRKRRLRAHKTYKNH